MASLGHVAVGMAVARLADGRIGARSTRPGRSLVLWSLLALLPDVDAIGFALGVRYEAAWGHRGATHSLAFAIAGGVIALLVAPRLSLRRWPLAALVTLTLASHGLLDMGTTGGLATWRCKMRGSARRSRRLSSCGGLAEWWF